MCNKKAWKRAMIMTPSVRTRNILIITFKRATEKKKYEKYIVYIISTKVEQNMCQRIFSKRYMLQQSDGSSSTTTSLTHSFFPHLLLLCRFSSVLLLCYLWVFRLSLSHAESLTLTLWRVLKFTHTKCLFLIFLLSHHVTQSLSLSFIKTDKNQLKITLSSCCWAHCWRFNWREFNNDEIRSCFLIRLFFLPLLSLGMKLYFISLRAVHHSSARTCISHYTLLIIACFSRER